MYGPPANTPTPLKVDEYATPSWLAMKPPADSPDTVICVLSTFSLGRDTAACAAKPAIAKATVAPVLQRMDTMSCLLCPPWIEWEDLLGTPLARRLRIRLAPSPAGG